MKKSGRKTIDLFMFMGQSNMAGRGISTGAYPETVPRLTENAGYEYRAVSSPDTLHILSEPFGCSENRQGGIDDGHMKTGSMVTAFVNEYYKNTGVAVVGVSASKGGSRISQWQPGGIYLTDAVQRLKDAVSFLERNEYTIRHRYMLWCQGESDGDISKPPEEYRRDFECMLREMLENGIEKCFMIRIGNYNGNENYNYTEIIHIQDEIAKSNRNVVMVSTKFAEMKERGLMKDAFHYFQKAYNEIGAEAGFNTASYMRSLSEMP